MSWSLVEKILEEAGKHSTVPGKIWILIVFFFRILIITRIGDSVYSDEQAAFRCNNRQPGCENVCFTQYSPLSFIRFSALQVIVVTVPLVCFILYSAHTIALSSSMNPNGAQNSIFKLKKDRRAVKLETNSKIRKNLPLYKKEIDAKTGYTIEKKPERNDSIGLRNRRSEFYRRQNSVFDRKKIAQLNRNV